VPVKPPKTGNRRAGLSEVMGGLIVALAMIGLATSLYTITVKVSSKAAAAAEEASLRLDEALTPPQMMLRLEDNGSLLLQVYTVRAIDVERVIVAYKNGSHRELEGARVDGSWSIVVDPSYGCEPVRIALVTSRGNVFYYSPLNDPSLDSPSPAPGGYIDCGTLIGGQRPMSLQVYQGGSIATLVNAGYSAAAVNGRVALAYSDSVQVSGPMGGRCWASVYRGGNYVGSLSNGDPLVLGTLSVEGVGVSVSLLMACAKGYSALYLVLDSGNASVLFAGNASITYSADTYRRYLPGGGLNDTMLPIVYSPIGSFRGEAELRYKYGSAGNYIESRGWGWGLFNTTRVVVLLVNSMNVEMWVSATIKVEIMGALVLSLEGAQAPLNIAAPLKVSRECPAFIAGDDVTRSIIEAPWRRPEPEVTISHDLGVSTRALECGDTIIVEAPASAVVGARFPPPLEAPLLSSISVESTGWELGSDGWYTKTYNISSAGTPVPSPWRAPHALKIEGPEGTLLVVAQNGWVNGSISQVDATVLPRTSLIAGLAISAGPPGSKAYVYYSEGGEPIFRVTIVDPRPDSAPMQPQRYAIIVIVQDSIRETEFLAWLT